MSLYVIDDHPLMRDALAMVLRRIKPATRVVELDRVGALSAAVKAYGEPDLICLDLRLPDVQGVEGVLRVKQEFPNTPLAVVSASPASEWEDLCLEAGADVYIEKSIAAADMTASLRSLLVTGESELDDAPEEGAPMKLSKRQKQLLVMMEQGLSNRDIAEQLTISEHTVKVHLWRLFKRMNVKSRTQAVHSARSQGWTV
jgi:DNA-binding NarL/FixJ family response regulator